MCTLEYAERIGRMDQDMAAHYGIERVIRLILINACFNKRDVAESVLPRSLLGDGGRPGVDVDCCHVPSVSNQPASQDGNFTDAATDVEHAHSLADSGTPEKLLHERVNDGTLQSQAAALAIVMAHHILGGGGFGHTQIL